MMPNARDEDDTRQSVTFEKPVEAYLFPWDAESCTIIDSVIARIAPKYSMVILAILVLEGPQNFGVLRRALGASAKTLAERLRALEAEGLIARTVGDGRVVTTTYSATSAANEFYDVLCAMRDWGRRLWPAV